MKCVENHYLVLLFGVGRSSAEGRGKISLWPAHREAAPSHPPQPHPASGGKSVQCF